ncbi:DgyrCDS1850 [Dimorphilus gyrociliatus]|uniref:DgyrCDS1850 n=1 Tax=Dimorphilus gyrociliatus TaxID=2664684 RepID=A0A7I8VDN2_9ANNE|nr:DgyrCDS1850 [Dimorphilus gyrociliatus]
MSYNNCYFNLALPHNVKKEKLEELMQDCDSLASLLSTSVSSYVHKELDEFKEINRHKDSRYNSSEQIESPVEEASGKQLDEMVDKVKNGVDECFKRAKAWANYVKQLTKYVEQRCSCEMELARNVKKLAENYMVTLKTEEVEHTKALEDMCRQIKEHHFVSQMRDQVKYHEDKRKTYYNMWTKAIKSRKEAEETMIKLRNVYDRAHADMDRLKMQWGSISEQDEPKSKERAEKKYEEARTKVIEHENSYKQSIAEANSQVQQSYKTQKGIITALRQLLSEGDAKLREQSYKLFQSRKLVAESCPPQLAQNEEECKKYSVNSHYAEFIRDLCKNSEKIEFEPEPFKFEPYEGRRKHDVSDTDSISGSSSKSRESSPVSGSPRSHRLFEVSLNEYSNRYGCLVPPIVTKCIDFLESGDNLMKEGLYRVPGLVSKEKQLTKMFETHEVVEDLTDSGYHVVASVLKKYFRQLPEPLLMVRLYDDFIKISEKFPEPITLANDRLKESLRDVVKKLDKPHYETCATLMNHLYKVAEQESNHMDAFNLGVVFGPNLMGDRQRAANMQENQDRINRQNKVIHILIEFAPEVFKTKEKVELPFCNQVQTFIDSASQNDSDDGANRRNSYPSTLLNDSIDADDEGDAHQSAPSYDNISKDERSPHFV